MNLPDPGGPAAWVRATAAATKMAGLIALLGCCTQVCAQVDATNCPIGNTFGDYVKDRETAAKSERFHFTPKVEALIAGESTEVIGADLHFMLQNYPNHHRVLVAMVRLGDREKTQQPRGAQYTIDCYFSRAIRFNRDDVVARMLYADYLAKHGRPTDASAQLEGAAKLAADNPFTQYNVGLIYLEMKNYDKALEQAHKAYALGFSRPELRDRLKSAGRWKEPADAAAPGAAAGAASAPDSAASASN